MDILNSVPSQAWIAFCGVLIGSIFTIIGTWITNQANNQRLRIQFEHDEKVRKETLLREKLEDLYIVSHKYFNTLVSNQLPYKMVMKGEITLDEAHDLIIEWAEKKDYEPQSMTMLINMYFSELKSQYDEILNIRNNLSEITNGYKEQYKTGDTDGSKWLKLFQPEIELLASKTTQFEEKLTNLKINV